jgi:hypothetical protein
VVYPVIDALNSGTFIRSAISLALKIAGGFFALSGLIALAGLLKVAFSESLPAVATLGFLLFAVICFGALAICVQIMWYRAESIGNLDNTSGFVIMPIVSILLRMVGEIYATLLVALGVGAGLAIWLGQVNPLTFFSGFTPGLLSATTSTGFMGGLTLAALGCLGGFAFLIAFYFLAELAIVLASIARDMRALAAKVGA